MKHRDGYEPPRDRHSTLAAWRFLELTVFGIGIAVVVMIIWSFVK